ncbi:MAG: response regulator [Melioribacteraceae bacterium]|nr:response regulator [Melioribacteraceae bacterium]
MDKVLFVDDDQNILNAYRRNLRGNFDLTVALGPIEALKIVREKGPFAVVISDFKMPVMNGIELLSKIKNINPDTVRIILTGHANLETAISAVNEGNIFRFLTKPCQKEQLLKVLYDGTRQYQLINNEKELLDKTLKGTIKVLLDILSIVNPSAFSKAARIRNLAVQIGKRMKLKEQWIIEISALLSQIGCIGVPGEIIEKINQGHKLTENEKEIFYSHPNIGIKLLEKIPRLDEVKKAIEFQNIRYDGSGGKEKDYISGDSIPLMARMLKVINDYDIYSRYSKENARILEIMNKDVGAYDTEILLSLEAVANGLADELELKSVFVTELKVGMMAAENIKDESGKLLISKDTEISSAIIFRLNNYSKINKIVEPIKVLSLKDK